MKSKKKKLKIRKGWGSLNPLSRIKESDKKYNRKKLTDSQIRDWIRDNY